jgi:hypothetical protein
MPKIERFARIKTAFECNGLGYYKVALYNQASGITNWNQCSDRLRDFKDWVLYIAAMDDHDPEKQSNVNSAKEMDKWFLRHTTVISQGSLGDGVSFSVSTLTESKK